MSLQADGGGRGDPLGCPGRRWTGREGCHGQGQQGQGSRRGWAARGPAMDALLGAGGLQEDALDGPTPRGLGGGT